MKVYTLSSTCVYLDKYSKEPSHPYTYVFSSEKLALQKLKEIQQEHKSYCKKNGKQISTSLRDAWQGWELYIRTETMNLVWICRWKLIDGEVINMNQEEK